MSYAIGKRFSFEAGHRLGGLPEGHKCARPHGHSYTVEVIVTAGELSGPGFVTDFADLDPLGRHLADAYDHRMLNDVIEAEPTSENLARVLFDWCAANIALPSAAVAAVRVSETPATWAEYRPEPAPMTAAPERNAMATATLPIIEPTGQRPVPVSELFYSFQGEGVNLGRRALFVRFMDCNLTCGYSRMPSEAGTPAEGPMLCDTEYTWNGARHDITAGVQHLTAEQIWDALKELDPSTANPEIAPVDLIVASGGEPLLRKDTLLHLAAQARRTGRQMEIETNATICPGADLIAAGVAFNAGLKLASSAVPRKKRIKPDAIRELQASGKARWKFVVCGAGDLDEIAGLQREFGLTEIWLSPEGTTPAAITGRLRMTADAALAHGWNLTLREHVLIWGDERGR